MKLEPTILVTKPSLDYELLDCGQGEKLERFGGIVLVRPDPQALWAKRLPENIWREARGTFNHDGVGADKRGGNGWSLKSDVPARWVATFGDLKFWIKPTPFKHVGIFPEQSPNWAWLGEKIKVVAPTGERHSPDFRLRNEGRAALAERARDDIDILNLFSYTGAATLACAKAGANVVHVDSSKSAITWARENAELSGLADKPIRWIVDDARTFVQREIKRGRKYHGIIMDPPAFGHGPDSELWKIEEHFLALVKDCLELLADKPLFFLINGYSAGYSSITYANNLSILEQKFGGNIEMGELAIEESGSSPRLLPAGIFARWSVNK